MTEQTVTLGRKRLRSVQAAVLVLVVIVLAFAVARVINDAPHIAAGTTPEDEVDREFVRHPWLAYLHIAPGVLYLLGVPLQLAYRFRSKHYTVHRRMGRVLLPAALVCGVFAIIFGIAYPFGGAGEAAATIVFGIWFLYCLVRALLAIKRRDAVNHRRWMIRAFAVGVGVGTVRIWVFALSETGVLDFQDSFAVAFWLSFSMHAAIAEWWVRTTPFPGG